MEESVTMSTAGGGGDDDRLGGAGHLQRELKGCGKTDGQSEVLLDGGRESLLGDFDVVAARWQRGEAEAPVSIRDGVMDGCGVDFVGFDGGSGHDRST